MSRYEERGRDDRDDRGDRQGNGSKGNGKGKEPWVRIGPYWTGSGYVGVSIWLNEGKNGPTFSMKLQKRYKTDKGEYEDSDTLFPMDAPIAALALNEAMLAILHEQGRK